MAGEDKTEKASPKRRRDERKKGNVFQSKDVVTVGVITISFIVLKIWIPYIYIFTRDALYKYISMMGTTLYINEPIIVQTFNDMTIAIFGSTGILFISVAAVSIIFTGAQTKFLISWEHIKLKFSNINPLKGIRRMFSLRSVVEMVKNLLKIAILGNVVYSVISNIMYDVPKLVNTDLLSSVNFIFISIISMVKSVLIAFITISAFDFLYQWWEYEKNIKMSKQEVKEEYKQMEGDPKIKGKIKEKQRSISMTRMMQQVPNADVIIRNPTHYAVAIKYDLEKDNAPLVLAKGKDNIALKIVEKASEFSINMVENKQLARALYENTEINREIPQEYYESIAEILAWVYRLKEKEKK